jgi:Cdc6-like AAA superfamily ATPase
MHKNQLYLDTSICLFLTGAIGTGKFFTLKLIIQGLLQLYNRDIFDLTKTKVLLMALISKVVFNIDVSIIHSTLNIKVSNNPYLVYQTYHQIH